MAGTPYRAAVVTMAMRFTVVNTLGLTISPPFAGPASELIVVSIPTRHANGLMINEPSTARRRFGWSSGMSRPAPPAAVAGLKKRATRVMLGATSATDRSICRREMPQKFVNPVMFLPGRAKLATNPLPIGSETFANTTGTRDVSRLIAAAAGVGCARMTSGSSCTNSEA